MKHGICRDPRCSKWSKSELPQCRSFRFRDGTYHFQYNGYHFRIFCEEGSPLDRVEANESSCWYRYGQSKRDGCQRGNSRVLGCVPAQIVPVSARMQTNNSSSAQSLRRPQILPLYWNSRVAHPTRTPDPFISPLGRAYMKEAVARNTEFALRVLVPSQADAKLRYSHANLRRVADWSISSIVSKILSFIAWPISCETSENHQSVQVLIVPAIPSFTTTLRSWKTTWNDGRSCQVEAGKK